MRALAMNKVMLGFASQPNLQTKFQCVKNSKRYVSLDLTHNIPYNLHKYKHAA